MKLLTEVDMQPSESVQEKTGTESGTSNSKTSPSGGRKNTSGAQRSGKGKNKAEILQEVNDELANLLVFYADLGGRIEGITLPEGQKILGSRHVLVLPADFSVENGYSLQEEPNGISQGKVDGNKETGTETGEPKEADKSAE